MRPVNLLPAGHRPRTATGAKSGSAYLVIGVLGLILVAVAVYAFHGKLVADREAEAARLSDEAAATEAEAARLAPFGQFAALKQARLTAVATLAAGRIDWERLARELSLVLPARVWLSEVQASSATGTEGSSTGTSTTSGSTSSSTSSSTTSSSTTTPTDATGAPSGPSVTLVGCAPGQPSVATMLVRLRRLHRAADVKLRESAKVEGDVTATGTGVPTPTTSPGASVAPAGAGATGEGGCLTGWYTFEASVELTPAAPAVEGVDGVEKVPAALGGGL